MNLKESVNLYCIFYIFSTTVWHCTVACFSTVVVCSARGEVPSPEFCLSSTLHSLTVSVVLGPQPGQW
jgi:hypothetical protein